MSNLIIDASGPRSSGSIKRLPTQRIDPAVSFAIIVTPYSGYTFDHEPETKANTTSLSLLYAEPSGKLIRYIALSYSLLILNLSEHTVSRQRSVALHKAC